MTSSPNVFQRQKSPPKDYKNPMPKYCSIFNHHHIILFQNASPMLYNLDQQRITKQYQYPSNFYYDAIQSCIDHQNNMLYIVDQNSIISLDMVENKWSSFSPECINEVSTHSQENSNFCLIVPKNFDRCHFIPSPINELHVMTKNDHYKYNHAENTITNLLNIRNVFNPFRRKRNMFYRKSTQQLFMYCPASSRSFIKDTPEILICDANIENKSWSKWKTYEQGLPPKEALLMTHSDRSGPPYFALPLIMGPVSLNKTYESDLILAFDQILFYFEFVIKTGSSSFWSGFGSLVDKLTIWCLDLDHNDKWHQTTHDHDFKDEAKPHVVKDDDNHIHLMRFDGDNRYHLKASLVDLVPMAIINLNKDKCDSLCIGYIRDFEKSNGVIFIPMYLKKIIVKFHPIFV